MATIAPNKNSTTAGCGCTPDQTELIARAACYLRLEEQSETQLSLLMARRTTEQEKMFTALCGATDLAKLGELWKAYETATVTLDAEVAVVTKLQAVLKERTTVFAKASTEAFRSALEKRRCTLTEQYSREQQDTLSVQARITALDLRLKELGSASAHTAEAAVTAQAFAPGEQRVAKKT